MQHGSLESETQSEMECIEQWQRFCVFIQNTEVDQKMDDGYIDDNQTVPVSVIFHTGGQAVLDILHENGLNGDEVLKFKLILSKLEQLFLLKVITQYGSFTQSQSLDGSVPFQNEINESGNKYCVEVGNAEEAEVFEDYCADEFELFSSTDNLEVKPVVDGDNELKIDIIREGVGDACELDATAMCFQGESQAGEYALVKNEEGEIGDSGRSASSLSQNANSPTAVKTRKKRIVKAEKAEDFNLVTSKTRRSSRQIQISSRYAESRELIQNILKPGPLSTDSDSVYSTEPPCICSACRASFPDPKALVKHWKSHQENHMNIKGLPFLCNICLKHFAFYSQLKNHYERHNPDKSLNKRDKDLEHNSINESEQNLNEIPSAELSSRNNSVPFRKTLKELAQDEREREVFGQTLVKKHPKGESGSEMLQCRVCDKSFKNQQSLKLHSTIHTGERPYLCNVCGKSFRLKLCLTNHSRLHDTASHVKCDICFKSCVNQKAYEKHKLIHSEIKPYSCELCGKEFRHFQGYSNHQRLHKTDDAIQCDICEKKFVDKWGLQKHKSVHTGEKPYICSKCGKMFRLKRGMENHMKLHDTDSLLKCSLCPRTFVEQRKLDVHLKAHKGDKPFICDKCGKCFLYPTNLKVHKRLHTGEKPYHCKYCDKSFNQQGTLIAHERYHTGDRPYECEFCKEKFITKSQLTIHTRKHLNDRPYKCDQCDYAGYTSSILKIHMIKHSTGRPYKCLKCSATFKRQQHLDVHNRVHLHERVEKNEVKKHKCVYCEKSFDSEVALSSHLASHEIVIVSTKKAKEDIFVGKEEEPEEVAYNIVVL